MIEFERVWFPQIVSYAKLISTGQLEDEWLGRLAPKTSVTDPNELHEQVFDDLDAERIWAANRDLGLVGSTAREGIDRLLAALLTIDQSDPRLVVASASWSEAKVAASLLAADQA